MRVCLCLCLCVGDGEQVDRELDHDDRDHGVRELDALRLQDGYLLCVMDCFVVVVGLAIARWAGFCGPVPDELMIGDSAIPLPESRSSGRYRDYGDDPPGSDSARHPEYC